MQNTRRYTIYIYVRNRKKKTNKHIRGLSRREWHGIDKSNEHVFFSLLLSLSPCLSQRDNYGFYLSLISEKCIRYLSDSSWSSPSSSSTNSGDMAGCAFRRQIFRCQTNRAWHLSTIFFSGILSWAHRWHRRCVPLFGRRSSPASAHVDSNQRVFSMM